MEITYDAAKGKECPPEDTIRRIKKILDDLGLNTVSTPWRDEITGFCSCRVAIEGTNDLIASNGKGATELYSLASGYAELMERLSNTLFMFGLTYDDFLSVVGTSSKYSHVLSLRELIEAPDGFMSDFLSGVASEINANDKALGTLTAVKLLREGFEDFNLDKIVALPYYDYVSGEEAWVPEYLSIAVTGSNGMASGNTLEEAIVQAASEIFERYSQGVVIRKRLTPPTIPDEELKKVPHVWNAIEKIRETDKYEVIVKDLSLGEKFPVVSAVVINKESQTFGFKAGASPSFAIALERVFTEASQGTQIDAFSRNCWCSFNEEWNSNEINILNVSKTGSGSLPVEFFAEKPSWEYTPWEDVSHLSNGDLARRMLDLLAKHNDRLLIRDASTLGFPSVHIHAQPMGKLYNSTSYILKEFRATRQATLALLAGAKCDQKARAQYILRYYSYFRNAILKNTITGMYSGIPVQYNGPCATMAHNFVGVVCYVVLGNYAEAANSLSQFSEAGVGEHDYRLVKALKSYCKAKAKGVDDGMIRAYLKKTVDKDTYQTLCDYVLDCDDPLALLLPECHAPECDNCDHKCIYQQVAPVLKTVCKMRHDMGPGTENLRALFG